jgi:hypothetical protein
MKCIERLTVEKPKFDRILMDIEDFLAVPLLRYFKYSLKFLSILRISSLYCDQKLASDSSGLPGGFSGQRAWVRIFKKMGARQLLS